MLLRGRLISFLIVSSLGYFSSAAIIPRRGSEVVYPTDGQKVECKTDDDELGTCMKIEECPSVLKGLPAQKPTTCFFDKHYPIVCCPDDENTLLVTDSPDTGDTDSPRTISDEKCGIRSTTAIEEGKPVSDSWPWMVAIMKFTLVGTSKFMCGGTLINPRFVLTAAHCFDDDDGPLPPSRYDVLTGLHTKDEGASYGVENIIVHEDYVAGRSYQDIALLKLSEDVQISDQVGAICLPTDPKYQGSLDGLTDRQVAVTGWGPASFGDTSSPMLQEATIPIVSNEACNASHFRPDSTRFSKGVIESQVCAGLITGSKDACKGDSGGPLVADDRNGRWNVLGIVTYGASCAEPKSPGVYTRVSSFLPWIIEHSKTEPKRQLAELYNNFNLQRSRGRTNSKKN